MTDLLKTLDSLGIQYVRHTHPAVFTVAQAKQHYGNIKGGDSKNLFLRNKTKSKYYLVLVESSKRLDLATLQNTLGELKLSFASSEDLQKFLGLTPGAVSPFGLINDVEKKVIVIIDSDLWKHDILHFHPNVNTETFELSRADFKKFLDWRGNEIQFISL